MTRRECHCTQGNHACSTRHGAPDGSLLLSPRPPPNPHHTTHAAEPISPSHQDPSTSHWWMRARTHAHWITLTINFTRTTYDLYTQGWRGFPICMLFFIIWVRVVGGSSDTKKERHLASSPLPVWNSSLCNCLDGYVSVQAFIKCVFNDVIDNKTQSFICWWRRRLARGEEVISWPDKLCCAECCCHISKKKSFRVTVVLFWLSLKKKSVALELGRRYPYHINHELLLFLYYFSQQWDTLPPPAVTRICHFKQWCWQCCWMLLLLMMIQVYFESIQNKN